MSNGLSEPPFTYMCVKCKLVRISLAILPMCTALSESSLDDSAKVPKSHVLALMNN